MNHATTKGRLEPTCQHNLTECQHFSQQTRDMVSPPKVLPKDKWSQTLLEELNKRGEKKPPGSGTQRGEGLGEGKLPFLQSVFWSFTLHEERENQDLQGEYHMCPGLSTARLLLVFSCFPF